MTPAGAAVTGAPATGPARGAGGGWLLLYALIGVVFGIALTKGEAISWFRIQEMFRFEGFHMYGIFASALAVAVPSFYLIRRSGATAVTGEPIVVPPKRMERGWRYPLGGLIFGVGWALTGACPGPLFALVGAGVGTMLVAIGSALVGTWVYAVLRPRLPH